MKKHGGNIWRFIKNNTILPGDILDFSANINPLGPPDWIKDVLLDYSNFVRYYPDPEYNTLRAALADHLKTKKEYIVVGNGAIEVIYLLCNILRKKRVLIPSPTFTEYEAQLSTTSTLKFPMLKEENEFCLPIGEVYDALNWAEAVILCNPNNPTGRLIEPYVIINLLDKACQKDTLVVIDESFLWFLPSYEEKTFTQVVKDYSNLVIISSLTKFFGIPGIRIGYAVTSNTFLLEEISKYRYPWNINIFAQLITPKLLSDDTFILNSRKFIDKERQTLFEMLSKIHKLKVYSSAVNFFLIRLVDTYITGKELYQRLCNKNILIRECSDFRGLDDTYIRIAILTHEQNIKLVQGIKEAIST